MAFPKEMLKKGLEKFKGKGAAMPAVPAKEGKKDVATPGKKPVPPFTRGKK